MGTRCNQCVQRSVDWGLRLWPFVNTPPVLKSHGSLSREAALKERERLPFNTHRGLKKKKKKTLFHQWTLVTCKFPTDAPELSRESAWNPFMLIDYQNEYERGSKSNMRARVHQGWREKEEERLTQEVGSVICRTCCVVGVCSDLCVNALQWAVVVNSDPDLWCEKRMSLKLPRNWDFSTFKAETARIGKQNGGWTFARVGFGH